MTYSERLSQRLRALGAAEGARISVAVDGATHEGMLMPHHPLSDPDVLVMRLASGYAAGLRVDDSSVLTLLSPPSPGVRDEAEPPYVEGRRELSLVATGGTIASRSSRGGGPVAPELSALDLLSLVPDLADMANIRAKAPFSVYSEDMGVPHWRELALLIADELNSGVDGVVVTHGTDTMGYTASALSFMLGDIGRPVVLVGAQRSPDRPSSDAPSNLLAAARVSLDADVAEVGVLMHDTLSDDSFALHRGTRVRKMHSSRRDAFRSPNAPPLATVSEDGAITYLVEDRRRRADLCVSPRTGMEEDVALLHQFPGMSPCRFESVIMGSKGVVVAGTGLGHASAAMREALKKAMRAGVKVVMSTQCLSGSTNLNVYPGGQELLAAGAIPVGDMLPETAFVKLMWAMANHPDPELERVMRTPLRGECGDRREADV